MSHTAKPWLTTKPFAMMAGGTGTLAGQVLLWHSPTLAFFSSQAAFAFIVLKDEAHDADMVVNELKSVVATKIAKYAVPDQILVSGRDDWVSCSP